MEWDLEIYRHVISQILIIIGSGCKSNNFYHHFTVCHFSTGQTCKRCLTIYSEPLRTIYLNKLSSLTLEIMTLVCKDLHWQLTGSHKLWRDTCIHHSQTSSNISYMSALGRKFCISEKSLGNWNCPRQSSVWFEIKITFEYHFFPVSLFASTLRKLVKICALHYYWYCWINISPLSFMDWEILTE